MFRNQSGSIAPFVILIILVIGIAVSTNLVQVPQIFKPKAAEPAECRQDDFPMIQDSCAKCISDNRPGLIEAIQKMRNVSCNVPKMISLWCNGNESAVANKDGTYSTGDFSYNTSPEATSACIEIMSSSCYQECRDTVLNHTIGSCKAVAHGFPAQPLEPNTKYEFEIEQTEMDGVPDFPNHVGIRRDGIPQEAHAIGPGFRYKVVLDSGAPGTHVLQMGYNDTSLYKSERGVDPNDPKQIQRFQRISKEEFEKLTKEQKEELAKRVPTSVVETPRYIARVVCLDLQYQVKGSPTPTPTPSATYPTATLEEPSGSKNINHILQFSATPNIGAGKTLKNASIYIAKRTDSGPARISRDSCGSAVSVPFDLRGFNCQNDRDTSISSSCAWCRIGYTTTSGEFSATWIPDTAGEYDVIASVEDSSFTPGDKQSYGLCSSNPYVSYPFTDAYGKFNSCGNPLRVTIR